MHRRSVAFASLALVIGWTATMASAKVTASVPGDVNMTPIGPGSFAAGSNAQIGALIGNGTTVTLASAGPIYAAVHDIYPWDNAGAFQVSKTAVP